MAKSYNSAFLVFKTVALYVTLSILWIFVSDWFLIEVTPYLSNDNFGLISSGKGVAFVIVTGLLLSVLLKRLVNRVQVAEVESRRSERSYRELFSSNPVPALVIDRERLTIREANAAALALYGYLKEELEGKRVQLIVPSAEELIRSDEPSREGLILEHCSAAGEKLIVRTQALPTVFQDQPAVLMLCNDETAWRLAGVERRKALHHLKAAQRVGQIGHWEYWPNSHQVFFSEGAARILGFPEIADQLVPTRKLADLAHFEAYERFVGLFDNPAQRNSVEYHLRVDLESLGMRDLLVRGEYFEDEESESLWVGTCVDLTERYQAEARLQERERQYRKLVEVLPDAVLVCQEETIVFANPAAAVIFGARSSGDLENLSIVELIEEQVDDSHHLLINQTKNQEGVNRIARLKFRTLDGKTFHGQFAARSVQLEGQVCIQILISDVSEREKIREALIDANKRLTSLANRSVSDLELERKVIAQALHDEIGQSLTAIRLSAGWLKRKATEPSVLEKIDTIVDIASDSIEKVRDLSLMLRPPQLEELGLLAAVQWQASRILDEAQLTWSVEAGEGVSQVKSPIDIIAFRVIQEAFTNAARHSRARNVEVHMDCSESQLVIEVSDDGKGFEPDKNSARLGLAFMKERVQLAGGKIRVESSSEQGTNIRVRLPLNQTEWVA
ncbi:PAS domain S-box protein [Marinobacter sp. BW6]|uniref:PAS domain-containing sensor histidine kinase n=1 Tax=Marinobacter sp. BW6 TaxID=2592624 RepID=UPI0011DEA289|nr:PAS domain S-box protein [Marinobacter sp. BW6]TYC59165.1 PAS domain S-box protein [Marinobacter sp. BW6]